jgi:hypothetical protein
MPAICIYQNPYSTMVQVFSYMTIRPYYILLFFFFFETGSCSVVHAGLKLAILLPPPPMCCDYKSVLLCLALTWCPYLCNSNV